jgi:exodeoxyribonuclease-5
MSAFAFGYALTVHMAQGSQFDRVLLIDEWPGKDRIAWLYTGITRAVKSITIARRA